LAHLTVLDAAPPALVSAAAEAGFDAVGIRLVTPASVGGPVHDLLHDHALREATVRRLADTGLTVLDVEFLRFEPDQPGPEPAHFLEVGAELGARNVLVMSVEPDTLRTVERFVDLCERAAPFGLTVNLEFAVYTGVQTLQDAVAIVEQAGQPNAAVLVDVTHFSRSGGVPAEVSNVDRRWLSYAQICDVAPATPADNAARIAEARTDRRLPGLGVFPVAELVARLPADLPLAVEAPVRALARLSVEDRARRAYAAISQVLEVHV
jgi:sugar phosphate isomerase/epimerase